MVISELATIQQLSQFLDARCDNDEIASWAQMELL